MTTSDDGAAPQDIGRLASSALRQIAADPRMRACFSSSGDVQRVLASPASRYILGRTAQEICPKLKVLANRGYRVGIEYVGEEASDPAEVEGVVAEYLRFLDHARAKSYACGLQIGFDLSNVGLLLDSATAIENTALIARAAAKQNVSVVISMERSTFTDRILDVFDRLAPDHPNLGLTIQAQLDRSEADLERLIPLGRKIRLVKGVYDESPRIALPRGPLLNERYVRMARRLAEGGASFAVASHDAALVERLRGDGILQAADEIEMLHGCNPALLRQQKILGIQCRISAVYGESFFLHFLHRLAEHAPNIMTALADYRRPDRIVPGEGY